MLRIGSTCECSMAHDGTKVSQLMHFHISFFLLRSRKVVLSPPDVTAEGQALKMTASNNTPECRLDVSSSGRRFELRVAALGCIASHAAHRLSSSKMELRSYSVEESPNSTPNRSSTILVHATFLRGA